MPAGKQSTFVKSFFAESIQAAMESARVELGTDALLLNSREAPPEGRHLGAYEVVFAAGPEPTVAAAPPQASGMETLKRQMDEIRELLVRRIPTAAAQNGRGAVVAQALIEAGVDATLANSIEEAARQRLARRPVTQIRSLRTEDYDMQELRREAAEEIAASFEVAPQIGRITALVGPPGSGKTTTLVKLAIQQGLALGRAVRVITTDTQRIGGAEQLRAYATILGASFHAVETAAALAQAIDSAPASTLVLIDTAGYSAALLQDLGGEVAGFLSRRQDIDTHLVLTASMRIEDLYRTATLYDAFRPAKLLFTRVDEATSLAAVFCTAARQQKQLSFLCAGQSVPEDLEPATKEKVVESLVRQLPSLMEAAA